jgi:multidrug efflux pump subunit AcrA (membrane-fusion protein)
MMFSLGTAAKAAGVSKSTIHRAVASGRMSARSKGSAGYEIDPAELFRVFPPQSEQEKANRAQEVAEPGSSETRGETIERSGMPVAELLARVARLEAELQAARTMSEFEQKRATELVAVERQRAEDARQRADELKAERDRWAAALEASQRQITHLTTKAETLEKPRGWWPFRRAG